MKYIYRLFIIVLVVFIAIGIYQQVNKKSPKASRLKCQKEVVFFEKVLDKILLQKAKLALKNGNYKLSSTIQKAIYMKSTLFNYVKKDKVDLVVKQVLYKQTKHKQKITTNPVKIKYLIYENDKLDPGKKTAKSKLYAGYLLFEFLINKHSVYKGQIDFMDLQGKDIPRRIECMIKAFLSIKEE